MANQQWKSRYSNGNARRKLRERVKAEGRECAICHKPIDYTLPAGHPDSYELDEILPFSLGGSPIDYNNVQPTHRHCNQWKSNKRFRKEKNNKASEQVKKEQTKSVSKW